MTIGEKIKYCRKQIGITQDKLAELTGIHPVSIRKYETNKMQPQPPQLEKIAVALGVSYNALNGSDNAGLRLETVGDLMSVLMVLCNSGILQISGERGEQDVKGRYRIYPSEFGAFLLSRNQIYSQRESTYTVLAGHFVEYQKL